MTEREALQDITENGINLGAGDYVSMDALKAAAKALEELALYKEGKLCLVPADGYKQLLEALEDLRAKEQPMKPIFSGMYACPRCKTIMLQGAFEAKGNCCKECGQRLDWEEA